MTQEEIDRRFDHHVPDEEKQLRHESVRHSLKDCAVCVNDLCPDGREKSLAMTYLELAMFCANAAIARS